MADHVTAEKTTIVRFAMLCSSMIKDPHPDAKQHSKGERTRALLLQAVADLVNSRPIEEIRVTDICKPAGLASGAFYFHFSGKDDAIDQMAINAIDDVFRDTLAVPHSDDLYSEIVTILAEFYRAYIEQRLRIRSVFIVLQSRRPVRLAWLEVRKALIARLSKRFESERPASSGGFVSDHVLAHFLTGALERFFDDVFFLSPDEELPAEAASYDVFVRQQALVWVRAINGSAP